MTQGLSEIVQRLFSKKRTGHLFIDQTPSSSSGSQATLSSLNLVYDLIHERLVAQRDQWATLDVKINFILSYATALVSASLVLQAVLLTLRSAHGTPLLTVDLLLPAQLLAILVLIALLVFYIITVILGIFAYKPRTFHFVPEPKEIFQRWLNEEEARTKQVLAEEMIEVFNLNEVGIYKKVRMIDYALATLFVEAFLLVPLIALQVVS